MRTRLVCSTQYTFVTAGAAAFTLFIHDRSLGTLEELRHVVKEYYDDNTAWRRDHVRYEAKTVNGRHYAIVEGFNFSLETKEIVLNSAREIEGFTETEERR